MCLLLNCHPLIWTCLRANPVGCTCMRPPREQWKGSLSHGCKEWHKPKMADWQDPWRPPTEHHLIEASSGAVHRHRFLTHRFVIRPLEVLLAGRFCHCRTKRSCALHLCLSRVPIRSAAACSFKLCNKLCRNRCDQYSQMSRTYVHR